MPSVMQGIETTTNTRKGVTLYSHPTGKLFHKSEGDLLERVLTWILGPNGWYVDDHN